MTKKLVSLLSIGGSDPCGCAGIQADIRAGISCGLHVMTAVTALTSQNSSGLKEIGVVSPACFRSQLNTILEEISPDAIKIGMIGSIEIGEIISEYIQSLPDSTPVILDPVMKASRGGNLVKRSCPEDSLFEVLNFYQENLIPYSTVVTPNVSEAKQFLRFNNYNEIEIQDSLQEIAFHLLKFWKCNAIILTGGDADSFILSDLLIDNFNGMIVTSECKHNKVGCQNLHGTGCLYSSLLASFIALGFLLPEAFQKTSVKIYEIIKKSCDYSLGESSYGPLNINNYRL